jgi:hypothetical protein
MYLEHRPARAKVESSARMANSRFASTRGEIEQIPITGQLPTLAGAARGDVDARRTIALA